MGLVFAKTKLSCLLYLKCGYGYVIIGLFICLFLFIF